MSDNNQDNNIIDQNGGMEHINGVHTKKQISPWNGDRPFKGGINAYMLFMTNKLEGCMKYLRAKQEHVCAEVKVYPNQELEIQLDDSTFTSYKFHVVHYGPLRNKEQYHWMSRYNIFETLQVFPPFRTLQVEMLQKGYYLMDESDPSRSRRMIIRLYKNRPPYPLYLWHGYGVIPTLGTVAHTNTELPTHNTVVSTGPFTSYIGAVCHNIKDDGVAEEKGDN
jgi:hypothetical protein